MRTKLASVGFAFALFLISGCSGASGDSTIVTVTTTAPGSEQQGQPTPAADTKSLGIDFLDVVCPSAYTLDVLDNAAIAAGSWGVAPPSAVRPAAKRALKTVQGTAAQLGARDKWPQEYSADLTETVDEFLAMATPLQQIVDADSARSAAEGWRKLIDMPRVAEQRLRTSLGLGLAWTNRDGCPRVPKASTPSNGATSGSSQEPAAPGPLPAVTSPMVEASGDALCNTSVYAMPDLVGPTSDASWTRVIQVMTTQYGFNPGVIDGQYGPNTISGVRGLQTYLGVVPDGQVGPITWTALQNDYCGGPPP